MPRRPVEAVAVHIVDDDLVGQADAEDQPAAHRRSGRQRLLRQHGRMAGISRHDGRAQPDAGDLAPRHGQRGERVEAEDVGHPG